MNLQHDKIQRSLVEITNDAAVFMDKYLEAQVHIRFGKSDMPGISLFFFFLYCMEQLLNKSTPLMGKMDR